MYMSEVYSTLFTTQFREIKKGIVLHYTFRFRLTAFYKSYIIWVRNL
jgi:hypothetical protein